MVEEKKMTAEVNQLRAKLFGLKQHVACLVSHLKYSNVFPNYVVEDISDHELRVLSRAQSAAAAVTGEQLLSEHQPRGGGRARRTCSQCKQPGHDRRTCASRKAREGESR